MLRERAFLAILFISLIGIVLFSPIVAEAKIYKIYVEEMPKHWESEFGSVLSDAIKYWKNRISGLQFYSVPNASQSDFVVQWASEYLGTKLGYYTSSIDNYYGKPYVAITLGYMDDESVKWQDRKFNRVDPEYATEIAKHEIGHAIGRDHSTDPDNIMYPSISNYQNWLISKFFVDIAIDYTYSESSVSSPYVTKALELQSKVNSKIDVMKPGVYTAQDSLYATEVEGIEAQEELESAWEAMYWAKKYLDDAQWTQKEAEELISQSEFQDAYYKYEYSWESVNNVEPRLFEITAHVNNAYAVELESEKRAMGLERETMTTEMQEKSGNSEGGGCLIATATYGSELATQVQQLRELRDNSLLQTQSGQSFMQGFNEFYYSFSPTIADFERESPVFKEMVELVITPLITSLSILNYVDMDSEEEVLGYGISVILLNIGMYFVAPAMIIIKIKNKGCKTPKKSHA